MRSFLFLTKYFLFWWALFILNRIVFIFWYHTEIFSKGFYLITKTFYYGAPLDISASAYLLLLPLLLLAVQHFISFSFYKTFIKIYSAVFIILICLISGGDLGIYSSWGTKLTVRAIYDLQFPAEAFESMRSSPVFLILIVVAVQVFFAFLISNLFFKNTQWNDFRGKAAKAIPLLVIFPFIILCMRGGLQTIPVNESAAFFSSSPVLNYAAVNSPWFLGRSLLSHNTKNPYQFYSTQKAKAIVSNLYNQKDSTVSIINASRPNIVFIQLESFTADIIQELGGDSTVTPNLNALIHNGILCTNFYATGFRTDQGLVAMQNGFPSQPVNSIIWSSEKMNSLPYLSKSLASAGYTTCLFYGGDLNFSNLNVFAHDGNFSHIVSIHDFSEAKFINKWGADDETMFEKAGQDLINMPEPFFAYVITLSSHEPFTIPMKAKFPGDDLPSKFRNACYFTDQALGNFMENARKENWFRNTLFILVADHGHELPLYRSFQTPDFHRIPCVFYGSALKPEWIGKKWNSIASQTDLPATLLHQLHLPAEIFPWSSDIFNVKRKPFAFYTFENGFGFIDENSSVAFDDNAKKIVFQDKTTMDSTALVTGKAYLQMVFSQYLSY